MQTITFIYLFALLASSLVGLVRFKNLTSSFCSLSIIVALTLGEEFYLHKYTPPVDITLWIYRLYTLIAFSLYYYSYYEIFKKTTSRYFSLFSILAALIVSVAAPITFEENSVFPSLPIFVCVSLLISNVLLSFYEMLLFPARTKLTSSSVFWYNTLNLFYWASTLVFFGSYNLAVQSQFNIDPYLDVHNILGILYYLGLGYVLLIDRKNIPTPNAARL